MAATSTHDQRRRVGETAVSQVARGLAQSIIDDMRPGDNLPSEADLAQTFGVSRVTMREALKMLVGRGLVDLGRGRRAIVREPDGVLLGEFITWRIQFDPKGVFDLVEVRLSLEVQSAGLAAQRANKPAIAALETTMEAMRQASTRIDPRGSNAEAELAFHRADVGFHAALAMASGNRILTTLFEALELPLQRSFFMSRRGRQMEGKGIEPTLEAHENILARVKVGDVAGARAAMASHLEDARRDMISALGETIVEPRA